MQLLLKTRTRGWVIDLRVLAVTAALLAVAIPAVRAWHTRQVQRIAVTMLRHADRLAEVHDWPGVIRQLRRYLTIRPNDAVARVRLAETYDRLSSQPQFRGHAIQAYYRAIGMNPQRPELRNRLGELLLDVGHYSAAIQQADVVLAADPANQQALQVRTGALLGQSRTTGVVSSDAVRLALDEALRQFPGDLMLVQTYLAMHEDWSMDRHTPEQEARRTAEVLTILDRAVHTQIETTPASGTPSGDPNRDLARLYALRHRFRVEQISDADGTDLDAALDLAPHDTEVLLTAGWNANRQQDFERAATFFEQARAAEPSRAAAYLGQANALWQLGQPDPAMEVLRAGLDACSDEDFDLNFRLAEMLVDRGQVEDAEEALNVLRHVVASLSPELDSERIPVCRARADQLFARFLLTTGSFNDALVVLRGAAAQPQKSTADGRTLNRELWEMLGMIYSENALWDRAAHAYENAFTSDPGRLDPCLAAARAWVLAGHPEAALRLCQSALELDPGSKAAWALLIDIKMEQQFQLPASQRDWTAVAARLEDARPALGTSWQYRLLWAKYRFGQASDGEPGDLRAALDELSSQGTLPADFWTHAIRSYLRLGDHGAAETALRQLQQLDPAQSIRWKAEWLIALDRWQEAVDLVLSAAGNGHGREVARWWTAAACMAHQAEEPLKFDPATRPPELDSNAMLPEIQQHALIALEDNDLKAADLAIRKIRVMEGDDGCCWRLHRAQLDLRRSEQAHDEFHERAVEMVAEAAARRPNWYPILSLQGTIADREGRSEVALNAYLAAVRAGEKGPAIMRRLVELLYEQSRFSEAEDYLQLMRERLDPRSVLVGFHLADSPGWTISASNTSVIGDSVRIARPGYWQDFWIAIEYECHGQLDQAHTALATLRESYDDVISVWAGYLAFLHRHPGIGNISSQQDALAQNESLPEVSRQALLAYSRERSQARIAPVSTAPTRTPSKAAPARAEIGIVSTARDNPGTVPESTSDATGQAIRPSEAASGTEETEANLELSWSDLDSAHLTSDRLLAMEDLLEQDGKLSLAAEHYERYLKARPDDARVIRRYLDLLLRTAQFEVASSWLSRLEDLEGKWASRQLRARWLIGMGRANSLPSWLEELVSAELARGSSGAVDLQQQAAELGHDVKRPDVAERWYRRAAERSPEGRLAYVAWLVSQQRAPEAIREWGPLSSNADAPAIRLLTDILRSGDVDRSGWSEVSPWLEQAVARDPHDPNVVFAVSECLMLSGRRTEALRHLRRLTEQHPDHFLAWNAIALACAEEPGQTDEALKCIDTGLRASRGSPPLLLDTKARVLVERNQFTEALRILDTLATTAGQQEPRYHLHLAYAHWRAGDQDEAKQHWQEFCRRGLSERQLMPLDRRDLAALTQAFPPVR